VSGLGNKRVLLLEDEVMIAMMVEELLSELGAVVVGPVSTIRDAAVLAVSAELDAAVLDVNVRGTTSFEVAEILQNRRIPIVFATGYSEVDRSRFPGSSFLVKPYTAAKLEETLQQALSLGNKNAAPQ
jgi:CheY-like chemotaxis protein